MNLKLISVLAFTLASTGVLHAQTNVTGSGGTLSAPTTLGQLITASSIQTTAGVATMTCPITWFGATTYQWRWSCSGGTLSFDQVVAGSVSGSMTLTCSGGGRAHPTVCWHNFVGQIVTADGVTGSLTISAKGGVNNVAGIVTAFQLNF